jgi:exosortase/archaeosortase family protein
LFVFAASVAVLLYTYSRVVQHAWFDDFLSAHAAVTAQLIRLTGVDVDRVGSILSNDKVAFTIISECTPTAATLIFASGIIAFPAPWRGKLAGLVLGVVALFALNIIRIVNLFFVGIYVPSALDALHLIVWQSLMILVSVGLLFLWTGRISRDVATTNQA